jgi:hypothetical protein
MRQRCDSASELHRTPHSPSIGQGKLGTSPPPRRRNLAACETKPRRLQIQQLSPAADGGGDAAIKPTAASPHAS